MTAIRFRLRRVMAQRLARLLAVAGLVVAAGGAGALTAAPATAAACSSSAGVTVVVDFGRLGGTSVGCASSPGTGVAALQATGHAVTYVPRQPGFVCTIDRRPDPCNGAPVTAYWSYWHASPGGSWVYSTSGAGARPKPGSVEGWAFGAGKPPSTRPPAVVKPNPASHPTTSTTTHRSSGTSSSRPASGSTRSSSGAAGASGGHTGTPSATSASPSGTGTTSPGGSATTGDASTGDRTLTATRTDAAVPTSATSDTGNATTLVVAGILVLLLAGGGALIAWRRRGSGA